LQERDRFGNSGSVHRDVHCCELGNPLKAA
jgi:hypothetical protein